MNTPYTEAELKELVNKFVATTSAHFGAHAYAAGYLNSMVVSLLLMVKPSTHCAQVEGLLNMIEQYKQPVSKEIA